MGWSLPSVSLEARCLLTTTLQDGKVFVFGISFPFVSSDSVTVANAALVQTRELGHRRSVSHTAYIRLAGTTCKHFRGAFWGRGVGVRGW